jgi:hypothetical protein
MVNRWYTTGLKEIQDRTIDWVSDTIKIMAVNSGYVFDADDLVVDAGGANDPVDHEITATNYTKGWGGAGRKSLGGKAIGADLTNDRVEFDCNDWSWTALGGAANDTIDAYIAIKEGVANDTTSRLIMYIDDVGGTSPLPLTTNGSDVNVAVNAEGLAQLPVV